jgi:hypothetical protein
MRTASSSPPLLMRENILTHLFDLRIDDLLRLIHDLDAQFL